MATAKPKNELKPVAPNAAPAFLAARAVEDAGKGVSRLEEDNLVPLVYVFQPLSPQVNKRGPDYLEGAEPGGIWLRNSGLPPIKGDEGILVQPVHFSKDWVEWIPRAAGGGFAGRHKTRPAEAVETTNPQNPDQKIWMLPNGHELKETRYHVVNVKLPSGQVMPYVIPMTSSGHTVSRAWMFMMSTKQVDGTQAPSWSCLYRLKTKERTNAKGTWSIWDVSDAGWVQTLEEYEQGAKLNAAFATGEKEIATDDDLHGETDSERAPM